MSLYSYPFLYSLAVRLLFGKNFRNRYNAVAELIPDMAEVVDVCSGDCRLYLDFLRHKGVRYIGLDNSPEFISWATGKGISAKLFNILTDDVPISDYVVMQSSLYQFIPRQRDIVEKLLCSSRKKVIISEPVRNLSASNISLLAKFSRYMTRPKYGGETYLGKRFNKTGLTELFNSYAEFEEAFLIPGGIEMIGIFRGKAGC